MRSFDSFANEDLDIIDSPHGQFVDLSSYDVDKSAIHVDKSTDDVNSSTGDLNRLADEFDRPRNAGDAHNPHAELVDRCSNVDKVDKELCEVEKELGEVDRPTSIKRKLLT